MLLIKLMYGFYIEKDFFVNVIFGKCFENQKEEGSKVINKKLFHMNS